MMWGIFGYHVSAKEGCRRKKDKILIFTKLHIQYVLNKKEGGHMKSEKNE